MTRMKPGLTGNEVLAESLAEMNREGISGRIYNHPIGDFGHGPGAIIGLWDRQEGVPGRGDVRLIPDMWHSIELNAVTKVPEWDGQEVRIALEEDAAMTSEGKMKWILNSAGRIPHRSLTARAASPGSCPGPVCFDFTTHPAFGPNYGRPA